jgi:hypothetical protein
MRLYIDGEMAIDNAAGGFSFGSTGKTFRLGNRYSFLSRGALVDFDFVEFFDYEMTAEEVAARFAA